MHKLIDNLVSIERELKSKLSNSNVINIIAVSKTFPQEIILPLIDYGHVHFGENKVQEALIKWTEIKKKFSSVKLHMVGKLQSNKVKYILPLFDYLHSLDNEKLAQKISLEEKKHKKKLKIFIQINFDNETQKSGINPNELEPFFNKCIKDYNLNIIGLMCLPPKNNNSDFYFSEMLKLKSKIKVKELSMGMSSDYLKAAEHGSSFLRLGTKIFGQRD